MSSAKNIYKDSFINCKTIVSAYSNYESIG